MGFGVLPAPSQLFPMPPGFFALWDSSKARGWAGNTEAQHPTLHGAAPVDGP